MALQSATLLNAINNSQTTFMLSSAPTNVPSVGGVPLSVGVPAICDSELMMIVAQPAANLVSVRRGVDGSAVVAHDTLANVYIGLTAADIPAPQIGTTVSRDFGEDEPISLGQDQTITVPGATAVFNINKATAAALILPAPSFADNGVMLTFTSQTAAAHVITATGLIQDGTASVKNSMTFSAQKGASILLAIENGFYNVVSTPQNVTLL